MRFVRLTTVLLLLTSLCGLSYAASTPTAEAVPSVAIEKIEAFLYFTDTGTFSDEVLANSEGGLWNVIIGGGVAQGHKSNATLIKITMKSQPGADTEKLLLKVTMTTNGGKTVKEATDQPWFDKDQTQYHAAFWISDSGCSPVEIKALLVRNKKTIGVANRKLNFQCGE
jgi:hypothetical protein